MALEDDIAFLDRIPTFHVLGREARRILAISAESLHLNGGELLFEEDEPAEGGYVVVEGAISLKSSREMGGHGTIARAGTLIGQAALVVDTIRPATATALEATTLWWIHRNVFLRTLEGEPDAAAGLRRLIARRVESTLDELDLVVPLFEGG